jgi:hypothetical protein
LRTRQRAHNEVEIGCGKPRPTIRSDHRDFIMRDQRVYGKTDILGTDAVVSEVESINTDYTDQSGSRENRIRNAGTLFNCFL